MESIGQIIGFIAIIFGFFIFIQKERKNVLLFKLITDFIWIAHFYLIGAYPTMATTLVAVFREVTFVKSDKYPFLKKKIILIIFCCLFICAALLTWKGPQSLLPAIASSLATVAFFNKNISIIRGISFIVSLLMLLNGIAFNSFANIVNEIITMISIIIGTLRAKNINNKG